MLYQRAIKDQEPAFSIFLGIQTLNSILVHGILVLWQLETHDKYLHYQVFFFQLTWDTKHHKPDIMSVTHSQSRKYPPLHSPSLCIHPLGHSLSGFSSLLFRVVWALSSKDSETKHPRLTVTL